MIHSDLHHIGVTSHGGYNYWITFIDDKSRFKAAMPLKQKSEAFYAFKNFKAYAENQTGKKIVKLHNPTYIHSDIISIYNSIGQ